MKTLLALALTVVMVLATAMPAMAAITTQVTVSSGGGQSPVVKVKWEQEPIASLESADPAHTIPFSQFLPPVVKGAKKPIDYYAVVTDPEDMGNVSQVFADVFHPINAPPPYSTSQDPRGPLFKYEIPFAKVGHDPAAQALVTAAYKAGLIKFQNGFAIGDIVGAGSEMDKGTADLWKGTAMIDYEQPAGDYKVQAFAVDSNNNLSAVLENTFTYVAVAGVEIDFTGIVYGPVNLGTEKMVPGDRTFVSPPAIAGSGQANAATVRNIGNTWTHVVVTQDDMGFGKDVTGAWNVSFDARMGSDDTYKVVYAPLVATTLPNYLGLSTKEELDFSIKVLKGFGTHSGTVTVGAAIEPFSATGTPGGVPDPVAPPPTPTPTAPPVAPAARR